MSWDAFVKQHVTACKAVWVWQTRRHVSVSFLGGAGLEVGSPSLLFSLDRFTDTCYVGACDTHTSVVREETHFLTITNSSLPLASPSWRDIPPLTPFSKLLNSFVLRRELRIRKDITHPLVIARLLLFLPASPAFLFGCTSYTSCVRSSVGVCDVHTTPSSFRSETYTKQTGTTELISQPARSGHNFNSRL